MEAGDFWLSMNHALSCYAFFSGNLQSPQHTAHGDNKLKQAQFYLHHLNSMRSSETLIFFLCNCTFLFSIPLNREFLEKHKS